MLILTVSGLNVLGPVLAQEPVSRLTVNNPNFGDDLDHNPDPGSLVELLSLLERIFVGIKGTILSQHPLGIHPRATEFVAVKIRGVGCFSRSSMTHPQGPRSPRNFGSCIHAHSMTQQQPNFAW